MINAQTIIDTAIEENNQYKTAARDSTKFSISDAGTCYRKRYLKRLGIEPTTEIAIDKLRKMVAGDAGHEKLQSLLARHGMFAVEGEIETENIKGHFDGIMKIGKSKALLEFKTVEKWSMPYIKKDGPKPEHLIQMYTYWYYLRRDYTNLDQAILAYVKREDFESKDFNYLWEDKHQQIVEQEWAPLLKAWKDQELPECTCEDDYGGNGVKYCRYISEDGKSCCDESLIKKEVNNERTTIKV